MLVRKKTKIAFAYALLAASGLSVMAYDTHLRSFAPDTSLQTRRTTSPEPTLPLPITPISESPFLEAHPKRLVQNESALANNESTLMPKRKRADATSGFYFLKVAVQVDFGEGPVSFHSGTRVRLVRRQEGKFLVTRNGTDFLVEESQVTKDLDALPKLARNRS